MSNQTRSHDDIHELLAEHALGVLDGRQRAEVLSHLEACATCSDELDSFVRTIDSITEATEELEPPLGFETAVLGRIEAERLRRTPNIRRRTPLLLATAAAAVLLVAGGWAAGAVSSHTPSPTSAIRVVEGQLYSGHNSVGSIYASSGAGGWMVVALKADRQSLHVNCTVVTINGAKISLGTFATNRAGSSWWAKLPVPLSAVREITLAKANGAIYGSSSSSQWASSYTNVSSSTGSRSHSV